MQSGLRQRYRDIVTRSRFIGCMGADMRYAALVCFQELSRQILVFFCGFRVFERPRVSL